MVRWVTIALAVVGCVVGVLAVTMTREEPPQLPLARPAAVNPYDHGVAALGFIEPATREIAVVAPEALQVMRVLADVGQAVHAGDALVVLDDRKLRADLIRAKSALAVGQGEIDRWHALPRKEDLPPLRAALERARAVLADREEELRLSEEAERSSAANGREVTLNRYRVDAAKAEVDAAQAELSKAEAGGWGPDLTIAQANLARYRAEVEALELLIDRLTVRAPRDAVVLRRGIEPGEMASLDPQRPAMILGDLSTLRVRAQVDEEDIALVGPSSRAVARSRGARATEIPLVFVRVEPYGRPKTNLAGVTTERVDTRVIDVLFEVKDRPGVPLFPGQAVDVFIEAAPNP